MVDAVKEYREENEQRLLTNQKNQHKANIEQQQKFLSNVDQTIKNLDSVQGIKLSERTKKETLEYLTDLYNSIT